jgi:hypothetical protein
MKRAGIVIDTWKLEIFARHLKAGGFYHEVAPGLPSGTLLLTVETPSIFALIPVVEAAQAECATQTPFADGGKV